MDLYLRTVNQESFFSSAGTDEHTVYSVDDEEVCLSFDYEWISKDVVYIYASNPDGDRFCQYLHSIKNMGNLDSETIEEWIQSECADYFSANEVGFDEQKAKEVAASFSRSLLRNEGNYEPLKEVEIPIRLQQDKFDPKMYGKIVEAFLRSGQNMLTLMEDPEGFSIEVYPSYEGIVVKFFS